MDTNWTVAQALRRVRKRQGLTQQQVATRLGMTRGNYGHYEQGGQQPSMGDVPALARALNCSPADFFEEPATTQPFVPNAGQRMARKLLAQALHLPEEDLAALVRVADRLRELPPA